MPYRSSIIGVVFDFDDTLVPDSTGSFLESKGIDTGRFWTEDARALVEAGYDQTLAYLKLILDRVGDGEPLGSLTLTELHSFGAAMDDRFFTGLPQLFDDLRAVAGSFKDVAVEFYIVSSGLEDLIRGSEVVNKYFSGVYACRLVGDTDDGPLCNIQRAVTFTEKTRYLFEINKGIDPEDARKTPTLVNRDVPAADRRIPFENMIYVGDGLTDIPCFSLLKSMHGMPFGVFQPGVDKSAKQALQEFLRTDRVVSAHAPRYGPDDELGSLLRTAVATLASSIIVRRSQAESS